MEMKKKDFDEFFSRTTRIVERALDNDFDVVGDFFQDDDEETEAQKKKQKGHSRMKPGSHTGVIPLKLLC